jgi:dipeptidyl aminopeptidase/acylaminoacyl peptidase
MVCTPAGAPIRSEAGRFPSVNRRYAMRKTASTSRAATTLLCAAVLFGALAPAAVVGQERVEKGNLVIEGIPEIPERVQNRLLQYQNTRSAGIADWLPDGGGMLIATRFGETSQIHLVRMPGGARNQITFFEEPVSGASVSPDPAIDGFLFGRDVGGSEFYQLFFFDFETGDHLMLTDGKSRNGGAVWSNKGDRFAFFTTKRNGQDWDIHVMDMEQPGVSRPILEEGGTWFASDWSPDDGSLLVTRYVSAAESHPYILDLSTGALTRLNPTEEKVAYGDAAFAKDGRGIYFTSDEGSEFKRLRYYDLKTGDITVLTEGIPWDVEEIELSDDGRYLAFTANEDGVSVLRVLDTRTMEGIPLPEIPLGVIQRLSFSPDGGALGLVLETPRSPADVYAVDISGGKLVRWTYSEVGGLRSETFCVPTLIRYETFDKVDGKPRAIPAFYYKPKGDGPYPVLVDIHGGPEGQAFPDFSAMVQYFVNELGVAVLVPNVRGSSGYGKSYLRLDNGYKREDSVKDIGALLDWIDSRPELDGGSVAVIGGSYGGYMVLATMAHYNDRLRAGIDIVGISNFVTFLENTQDYRRDLRRVEYGDERDPDMRDFLMSISPTANAAKITKPLFVAQGLNDPRVPATESEQMVDEIRKNGSTVWYMLAKDEGHGFRKKTNRDYFRCAAVLFLEDYLLDGGAGSAASAGD